MYIFAQDLKKPDPRSSPTLSVKSLNVLPSSPRLGRVKFGSSPGEMNNDQGPIGKVNKGQYIVAVHRLVKRQS